ncbi:hypothetical protein M9Y10_045187 [Tritrichomonas musculus]|uniref:non-specific serine/threonine protein kinase n=1 Tax=Tritrichomonas musculus TaxID=1915356 RepID=A0ABR2JXI3_9EUKA
MSIPLSKKENKRQLREGDRIADFTVVKVLGHGGYGDIYLVKSRIHPDYLTRFAMKVEYPNKDNNSIRSSSALLKNTKNQNDDNQNDNTNEKGNDDKNINEENKKTHDNDNNNNANNNQDIQNNENNNNSNKENAKKYDNEKNNNKSRNRGPLRKSHLYIERTVLNALQDSPYFPRFISFGQTSLFRFLVMECFGPSLSTIKHVLPTGKFSLSSSLRIGIQMLRAIRSFHSHGYVHRDIKPSNFLIAASLSHPIILIDYGLARRFTTEKDRISLNNSSGFISNSNFNLSANPSEQNINLKAKFGFAGTTKYASINAHENKELGRRDDLFSWFYSLIELASGSLPWSSLREKDDIYQAKKSADMDIYIQKNSLPKQLCSIRILLESYSRTDEPDYLLIESFLEDAMRQNGSSWDDKYEWHRIDEESLSELSSIPLKPPKGDRYIQNKNLPDPILPSSKKSHKHKGHTDEDYDIAEINSIASKTKQRRHTSIVPDDHSNKRNRTKSYLNPEINQSSNLQHYAPQVDNQGRHSYFNSSEDLERYGHYGSDQLFSNSSSKLPSFRFTLGNKKAAASPISMSSNNINHNNVIGHNNDNKNPRDEKTSSNKQRKYVTTIKRCTKSQRKRRNSDPRQPPSVSKSNSSNSQVNLEDNNNDNEYKNDNDDNSESSDIENKNQGHSINGKAYRTLSNSNSIIFISHVHDKNDNDNDNNNNNQDDDSTNSMYYTYHSYSSGDDIFNNNIEFRNSRDNSYSHNSSNYYDSDSDDFAVGEKQNNRFSSMARKKNPACPAMEPKIDRTPQNNNNKKTQKNCTIQ